MSIRLRIWSNGAWCHWVWLVHYCGVLYDSSKVGPCTTGNWLFADCNFICQLFFFDTRQRGPFANWNFLQSAKQDLPTAWLCRLPGSWQSHGFADCQAVGKELQSAKAGHGWRHPHRHLCRLPLRQQSAKAQALPTAILPGSRQIIFIFFYFRSQFFVLPWYSKYMIYSKFGIILIYFAIFRRFFLFLWFFPAAPDLNCRYMK